MKSIIGVSVLFLLGVACTKSEPQTLLISKQGAKKYEQLKALVSGVKETEAPASAAPIPVTLPPEATKLRKMTEDCALHLSKLENAGYQLAVLETNENPSNPEGEKIQVAYYVPKTFESRTRPVVIFYNGGPAAPSYGSLDMMGAIGRAIQSPIILMDQRGTGCSSPLSQSFSSADVEKVAHYTSSEIVADSEAVRRELIGDQSWKIYGQSYGSLIVHRYLELYPEKVLSAHAHGFSVLSHPEEHSFFRLQAQARVWNLVSQKYPGLDAAFETLHQWLNQTPICVQNEAQGIQICGAAILDGLTMLLGFSDAWETIYQTIYLIYTQEEYRNSILTLTQESLVGNSQDLFSLGSVVTGVDIMNQISQSCKDAHVRLAEIGIDSNQLRINECRLSEYRDLAGNLIESKEPDVAFRAISLERVKENILKHGIRFYLYSGELDTYSPREAYGEEVAFLKDVIQYKNFPTSGHEGFYSEPEVLENLAL